MDNEGKYKKLVLGLIFDAMGYVSYLAPGVGEVIDVVWAPASAYLMTKMYKGQKGKIAAAVELIEEALPGLDFIPTFTLMWVYTYVISKKSSKKEKVIEVN